MNRFKLLAVLLAFLSVSLQAETTNCSKSDFDFVKKTHSESKLNESNLSDQIFKVGEGRTCHIKNELMIDGLSFTLYKLNNNKSEFIKVHNGLDGTSKTYGSFVR